MDVHHHKPSTTLARRRQLRGYRFHLDPQTQEESEQKQECLTREIIEVRNVNSLFDSKECYNGSIILVQEREDFEP